MRVSVLILFDVLIQIFAVERDGLIEGIKVDGISMQNENMDRENVIESFGSPNSYEDRSINANINPFFHNNMMKRSPIDRNTGRRQTGIIYGDGKPIGILQPYEESFKFMPIKEEKVYALDGGRSDLNEQEPYLNLMYPLARFARSEDALKMAEYEAARAEFLEKHYPSMLVDFKIRDKLHANRAKSTHQEVKREEENFGNVEKFEQKRQQELENRETGKRESDLISKTSTQKREADKPLKRETEKDQTPDTSKREAENSHSYEKNARKRETENIQKAEANSSPKFEERSSQFGEVKSQKQIKKKRENRLTDAEFDRLRNTVSRRNSMENVNIIEDDLRGLLNDMGLIEDDLEENAEEMEKVRSAVNEEINSDETADNPVLSKEKIESSLTGDDFKASFGRDKRTQVKSVTNGEAKESSNSNAETEGEHVDRKRSNSNSPIDEKRVIDVNFITKNREDKQLTAQNPQLGENRLRASDIPNKREASLVSTLNGKDRKKSIVKLKTDDVGLSTTESYSQYEERVAREIKNKIQMLKEEVQRELGALEEDNDEEDEDGESLGEPQRKKRFVANTLLDEEANNIDPNSNADSAELQPHIRRRRMLSTDLFDGARDQAKPANLKESVSAFGDPIRQSNSQYNMGKYEGDSQDSLIVGDSSKAKILSNQDKFMKEDVLKYVGIDKDERLQFEDDRNPWMRPQLYSKISRNFYYPQFQKRSFLNYVPWNAVRKQSRNLNTGVYSYESESEGDSDSRPQPECKNNVELDTAKKTQQFKYNSQPFPKDRTVEKPGYYVYYLGKNQEKKLENPQSSELHSRRNRPMNYQPMRLAYPQFYENVKAMQNKEQYMTANNDGENQKSMTFRLMYKVPSGRRKKRHLARNFFIPFKDTEDAIVTNSFSESMPGYAISNNKKKNSTIFNSDPTNKNTIDDDDTRPLKLKRINNNEKGEEGLSKNDKERTDSSDLNTNTQVESDKATDNNTNNMLYKLTSEDANMKILESNRADLNNNSSYKYLLESNNLYKSLPTVKEMQNNSKYSLEFFNSSSKSKDDIRVNLRRILSSTVNNKEIPQFQNIENTTFSFDNYRFEVQTQNVLLNSGSFGSESGRQNDIKYEAVPITELPIMDSSSNEEHLKSIKNNLIDATLIKESPNLTDEGMKNFTTNLSEESELIGDKVDKNDLYVSNEDYLPAEWKRHKRGIRLDSEDRDNVRKKRLNWFWPIKSSYEQNAPQNEEYDQFESNESSDTGKENSERFKENSAGVDNNYEDFGVDVGDYDRKKRQVNSFAPVFSSRNRRTYGYAGNQRLNYVPESRARRYDDGWYREPHRELLTDMSDVELFGALPQSYDGELSRYKRVKRGKWSRY